MSIVVTLDVFCDGKDCYDWTSGVTSRGKGSHFLARQEASKRGWKVKIVDGKRLDLCPDCLTKPQGG